MIWKRKKITCHVDGGWVGCAAASILGGPWWDIYQYIDVLIQYFVYSPSDWEISFGTRIAIGTSSRHGSVSFGVWRGSTPDSDANTGPPSPSRAVSPYWSHFSSRWTSGCQCPDSERAIPTQKCRRMGRNYCNSSVVRDVGMVLLVRAMIVTRRRRIAWVGMLRR